MPYHVGGVIPQESELPVANEQVFRGLYGIDAGTNCEATVIDPRAKTIDLRNVTTGEMTTEPCEKLVLSPGAVSVHPPLPGIDLPGIFQVRTVPDARSIREWIAQADGTFLLEVHQPEELVVESVRGAVNIPLPELRARLHELPRDRDIHVFCRSAQRSYYATRILFQTGFMVKNISGGMLSRTLASWLIK